MSAAVAAVLFDLDGTLYHQAPLRAAMLAELGTIGCVGEIRGPRLWRVLRTFRRIREDLRLVEPGTVDLEAEQHRRTAALTGLDEGHVRRIVAEWMFRRPLKYLPLTRRRGAFEAMVRLRDRGVHVGVFSDYPTSEKLAVLGLEGLVSLQVCATDPGVNAFKPHARGFLHACGIWGLDPARVVYVGDRPDVDARGAACAGMRCLIVGRHGPARPATFERVSFDTLVSILDGVPSAQMATS